MREIKVEMLKPLPKVPAEVLHKSGTAILKFGEELTQAIIDAIREAGVEAVFLPEDGEGLEDVRRSLTHVTMSIDDLTPGDKMTRTIYGETGQVLLEEGAPVPRSFAESMRKRNVDRIYFRRPPGELQGDVGRNLRATIEDLIKGPKPKIQDTATIQKLSKLDFEEASDEDFNEDRLRSKIDSMESIDITPKGEAFLDSVRDTRKEGPASKEVKEAFTSAIDKSLSEMKHILTVLGRDDGRSKMDLPQIDSIATRAMAGLIENRELLMLCGTDKYDEDYYASHALAMTVVAVNIGASMKLDATQVKALAFGAMLADVGMLKVATHIVQKPDKLSPREYAEIKRHPSYGLDILQRVRHLPEDVPYIVYQSHERANGSGYPCGKNDVVIHPFAKIVSLADIYTSVCAERPYRESKLPYEAMEQLVLMCGKRLLSPDIVRAFLGCNAMFPVGSFVRLSDKRAGRVVAANPEDYMRPIVAILVNESGKATSGRDRLNLLQRKDITVKQAVTQNDLQVGDDPMIGF